MRENLQWFSLKCSFSSTGHWFLNHFSVAPRPLPHRVVQHVNNDYSLCHNTPLRSDGCFRFERGGVTCHSVVIMRYRTIGLLFTLASLFPLHAACKCLGPQHDLNVDAARQALQDECFDVTTGYMAFNQSCFPVSLEHPLSDVTCFGQNPSSPYGTIHLKTPLLLNKDRPIWQIRQREAVLFLGCSPPAARYFGLQS